MFKFYIYMNQFRVCQCKVKTEEKHWNEKFCVQQKLSQYNENRMKRAWREAIVKKAKSKKNSKENIFQTQMFTTLSTRLGFRILSMFLSMEIQQCSTFEQHNLTTLPFFLKLSFCCYILFQTSSWQTSFVFFLSSRRKFLIPFALMTSNDAQLFFIPIIDLY